MVGRLITVRVSKARGLWSTILMRLRPVAAAPRSQSRNVFSACLLLASSLLFVPVSMLGQEPVPFRPDVPYVADIQVHTAQELAGLMDRADQLLASGQFQGGPPVSFVLHGEEARVFMRASYAQHKMLIDLAASLTALGVVNIRVCETWMGSQSLDPAGLQPFVGTVPNGMREVSRLREEENYLAF